MPRFLKLQIVKAISQLHCNLLMVALIKRLDEHSAGTENLDAHVFNALAERLALIKLNNDPKLQELLQRVKAGGSVNGEDFGRQETPTTLH